MYFAFSVLRTISAILPGNVAAAWKHGNATRLGLTPMIKYTLPAMTNADTGINLHSRDPPVRNSRRSRTHPPQKSRLALVHRLHRKRRRHSNVHRILGTGTPKGSPSTHTLHLRSRLGSRLGHCLHRVEAVHRR